METSESGRSHLSLKGLPKPLCLKSGAFPVSQETLLLLEFVFEHGGNYSRACDLGSGNGVMALALATFKPKSRVTGIEIQPALAAIAAENARQNNLSDRVEFLCADLRDPHQHPPHYSTDLVIANPPFRKLNTGIISPKKEKSIACHEALASLEDYIFCASLILRHHGYLALTLLPERYPELTVLLEQRKISQEKVQFVFHRDGCPANAVVILGRKGAKTQLQILPPLILT